MRIYRLICFLSILNLACGWLPSIRTTVRIRSARGATRPSQPPPPPPAATVTAPAWFPTRIQDSFPYEQLVQRLYVRQVVTLTRDMARLALAEYQRLLRASDARDPFARVAALTSADPAAATDGGAVGWVDAPHLHATEADQRLPAAVVEELFRQRPKSGDILTIQGPEYCHLLQVLEVWMGDPTAPRTTDAAEGAPPTVIGAYGGTNLVTPVGKLKGKGVLPEFPELQTYTILTAGCQMNVADSERLAGVLEGELQLSPLGSAGDKPTSSSSPDLVVLNTCSIRDHAEQKVYNALGPYAARKRQGQARLAIVVTGCVAQQEGHRLLQRVPEVDAVVGPQYVPYMKRILEQVARGQQVVVTEPLLVLDSAAARSSDLTQSLGLDGAMEGHPDAAAVAMPTNQPIRSHPVRSWVNVMYGCNEHCSYCVVPATRGMEQSRSMESILQECLQIAQSSESKNITEAGFKEITLIGQNVDAYGRDMVPKRTFADLLEFLNNRLPEGMRIRYVTSHPRYFSNRVIDAVASLDKVCECFHMPFQAGDDHVLKRMRRGYTFDSYMKIIDRIKEKCPNAGITTDIIVGFPGESEEAFQRTLLLMEAVKFDNVNSFAYSPRPNTEAALYEDQVPDDIKSDRLQRVQQLAAKHGLERSQRYLGKTVEVLVEDANPRTDSQVMGRTRGGRQVYFDGDINVLMGQLVEVNITEARTWSLIGQRLH